MKPAPFDYHRAASVADAAAALREAGGAAKLLAGGQSLTPLLHLRLVRPSVLVDLNRVPGLDGIDATDSSVRCGALVRHAALAGQPHHRLAARAARLIGHTAIRTRGTLGGSLAHGDPAAELSVVALAVGAVITAVGPAGERRIPVDGFFAGHFETTLADDEVVSVVELPKPQRWGFAELSRRHGDFALGLAAVSEIDGAFRIAVGAVGPVPVRAAEAEAIANAGPLDRARIAAAARAAAAGVAPRGDLHGSSAYRRALTGHLVGEALAQAVAP